MVQDLGFRVSGGPALSEEDGQAKGGAVPPPMRRLGQLTQHGHQRHVDLGVRLRGFRVQGLGFRVWGLGFGVWGLGFWMSGLGFGV